MQYKEVSALSCILIFTTQVHTHTCNARNELFPCRNSSNSNILSNEKVNSNYKAWIEINQLYLEIT